MRELTFLPAKMSAWLRGVPFEITPDFEGQGVHLATRTLVLGCRAGPEVDPSNLVHEMGHLLEIDIKRILRPGWGLKVPEVWVYDRMCVEPTTSKMTEREIRVTAYQANLQVYFGLEDPTESMARTLGLFMPDYFHIPGKGDEARRSWIAAEIHRHRALPEYQLPAIERKWAQRMRYLEIRKRPRPQQG